MFFEILLTAFTLQLLALPGEKGQLIISTLSTRYNPVAVAAGASAAFASWTAVEIIVGSVLKNALPVVFLDGATVALLILFGMWLVFSGPGDILDAEEAATQPTFLGRTIPELFGGVLPAFIIMAIGEVGDKTQLITISLAAMFGASPAIWAGEMLAIVPVSAANALLFSQVGDRINERYVRYAAALLFFLFAADITSSYVFDISFLPL